MERQQRASGDGAQRKRRLGYRRWLGGYWRGHRWIASPLIMVAVLPACGGGERAVTEGPSRTADPPRAARTEAQAAARSDRECIELWNAHARLGTAGQKAPADYIAEAATDGDERVYVAFQGGECLVFARVPGNPTQVHIFVARGGRAPFGHPSRMDIEPGRTLRHNARATAEGRIEPS